MPHDQPSEPPATSTATPATRYAAGLTFAHLLTVGEVLAVVWSLTGQTFGTTQALRTQSNVVIVAVIAAAGAIVVAVGGYRQITPALRWFLSETIPDERQR